MFVSTRDCMLPVMGKSNPRENLAALGLSAVEIAVAKPTKVSWIDADGKTSFDLALKADVVALQSAVKSQGVTIVAFLMGNDFSSADLEGEINALVKTAQAAEAMGIPAVRIDMLPHTRGVDPEVFIKNCVAAVKRTLKETSKVKLAVENHGNTSNRPEFLERVFGDTGDMRFGLTLDTGNFYWYGHPLDDVYKIMEHYASRVYHTHCKNISYPQEIRNTKREMGYKYGEYVAPIYEGDVDHKKVVAILRKAGYRGSMCIEDESLGKFQGEQRKQVLVKDAEYLKSLV
jgi:sugar phosphate isomerase/epimerase